MRRLAAVSLLSAVLIGCGRGDGLPGAPPGFADLLAVVPDSAVARGLYYTDLRLADGFGTALPLGDGALGFGIDDVHQVLESGEPPLTVAAGDFEPEVIDATLHGAGYRREDRNGWALYERDVSPGAGTHPAVAAVPAAAARGRLLVLGDRDEVAAALDGASPEPWLPRLVRAAGPEAAAVAVAPPPDPTGPARRAATSVDGLLDRHGARAPLAPYLGYLLAWQPDGAGTVALAYPPEAGGPEEAAALALRVATGRLAGEAARGPTDWWEPGAPRWHERAGVVVLPVRWHAFDPAAVRAETLLFLAPR